jgi:hypothetical protein
MQVEETVTKGGTFAVLAEWMILAIAGGHLACVKVLVEEGSAPVTEDTLLAAATSGQRECVAYLAPLLRKAGDTQGVWEPPEGLQHLRGAEKARQGVTGVCDYVAGRGDAVALQALLDGECAADMDWRTLLAAVRSGLAECVGYVTFHRIG